jgi:hypothetical protein
LGTHSQKKKLASPVSAQKSLKNSGFKWCKIINFPGAPTCLGPAVDHAV